MRKNCGIIAGMSNEAVKKIIGAISLRAFADEGGEGDGGSKGEGVQATINYEDLIAKARKEEKEKQYKAIEKLKTQVGTLTEQHNNDLVKIADLEKKLKDANDKLTKAGSGDSEEVKTLKETIKGLEKDKKELDDKVKDFESHKPVDREEVEAQVRAELEEEYKVKTYKAEKLLELKDDILVPELVMGKTIEEVDSTIKIALERSAKIKESLGVKDKEQKPPKRTPKTPSPSTNEEFGGKYTIEYLASLDVSSPEYAKVRKELGLK